MENMYTANVNKDTLDKLIDNMNEYQLQNMIDIINIYITISSLEEIKSRMVSTDNADLTHEYQMRWVAEFQNFLGKRLK